MKKGFTLIELLAVIVILAVISLITIPMLLNVVEDSRKAAFKVTCNEIYEAYNQYRINEEIKGEPNIDVIFDFNSGREETEIIDGIKYEPISKLSLKGELPKFGTYEVKDGKQELIVDNGKYTCVRSENRNEILDGAVADNDLTAPILREIILSSTTNSIKVIVDGYEEDGLITKYYYQINNGEIIERDTSVYVFNNLNTKEEYEIKVYVENKSGLKSEILSKKIETKEISGTTYEEIKTPEGYEYSTSKVLKIKYDEQTGLSYYLKADVEVEVVNGIIEECGSDTLPGVCTSTSVTTLEANKWYRTNISITNVVFRKNGNLYTTISDGQNTSSMSTYNVSKIDTTSPNVSLSISGEKTDRVTIIAVCSDSESGIIKYEYSDGTNWYDGGLNGSYTITGLSSNKEYEFKVRCTNGANETNEATESNSTLGITNPSVAYEKTPSTPANGYLTSEILKVTYSNENIVSPEYFVKTTRKGVSSLSVSESCGSGDFPGTCTSITSTTTLEVNTWYKVSGNVNVTYTESSSTVGTLYALTYDGTNYSGASTGEISKIDTSKPNVSLSISDEKTDRVTITAVCSDTETGITKYEYSDGNKWYDGGLNSSYTITGLSSNKEYEFKVRCTNGLNNTNEISESESTLGITNPSIAYDKTPSSPVNGYLTSETLKVTYSNTNIASPSYFVKTTRKGTSSLSVSESCGSGDFPGSCTNISNTTTLEVNTWYKVSGNVNVTYTEASSTVGTLYALTYDGTNYSGAATGEISKIDTTSPNVSLSTSGEKTDRVTITAVCSDSETGITKYEYSDGNKWYDGGLNSSYTITGLSSNKEYEFKVRCTNGVNKTKEASTKDSTLGITNPSIAYDKTPSTPVNGYLTREILKVTYTNANIAEPEYFVKTTRKGISSLSVSESCGNGDKPGTCTNITSTTTLEANTWYKVSGNVNVTYNEYATTTGTLYALTYDGTNYSGAATGEISKITKEVTYTVKHYQMNTDMTNYTLYETETKTATANYTTTPAVKTYTGFTSPNTQNVTVQADGSTVVEYRYARKQLQVVFYRNTSASDTTTATQTFTYGVSGQKFSAKGWTRSGYTLSGWSDNQSGLYHYSVTSGVSDNWINTNSPSINLYAVWIKNPAIAEASSVITSGYTWATSRTIKITYTNTNMASPKYYFKSSVAATVPSGTVTAACGTSENPGTCSSSSVTTLVANTWYQTTSTTPSVTFIKEGTLTAAMYDGKGTYATSTYKVENVSDGTPSAPTITGGSDAWSQSAKTISVSTESTVTGGIHHYQYCISGAPNTCAGTWVDLASGVKSVSISTNGTRYIVFRGVGNNGNIGPISGTQTTMIDTGIPTAPTITGGSGSWSQTAKTISVSTDSTSASPISYYQYCISGITSGCNGAWTDILPVGTKSISISENGTRYIYFRGVNVLGEPSLASNYQTTMIDTSNPTVSVSVSGKVATFTIKDNIGTVGYGINQSTTSEPSYTSYVTTSGSRTWTASAAGTYQVWVKDNAGRTARAQFTIASTAFCAYSAGQVWNYAYSGGVQSFAVPCSGTYKLEVWGAQGNNTYTTDEGYRSFYASTGGLGGYSYGNKALITGATLYVMVGGQNGYNGGGAYAANGTVGWAGANGGGATHITTTNRGVLSNYNSYRSEILIVAGGGGGAGTSLEALNKSNGGAGGGYSGGAGGYSIVAQEGCKIAGGGTQTGAGTVENVHNGVSGSFGQGGTNPYVHVGGGGGYFGGASGSYCNGGTGGGGGSGYIGGVNGGSMSNGQRSGHGYARITLVSITQ